MALRVLPVVEYRWTLFSYYGSKDAPGVTTLTTLPWEGIFDKLEELLEEGKERAKEKGAEVYLGVPSPYWDSPQYEPKLYGDEWEALKCWGCYGIDENGLTTFTV